MLARIRKPEYLFQPSAIFRKFRKHDPEAPHYRTVTLNWGLDLAARTDDRLCSGLLATGIDDLAQSEVIWRLLAPGEAAIDIGANIGYVTSIMAARVGKDGKVLAFEPHPDICAELKMNVSRWQHVTVDVYQIAISDRAGIGHLHVPPQFQQNRGLSRVSAEPDAESHPVKLQRLDEVWSKPGPVSLVKIDTEGHELEVLTGATELLDAKQIRNIIFEDHLGPASPSFKFLEQRGFSIYEIASDFLGPRLAAPGSRAKVPWLAPNYLASLDPETVIDRMRTRGWSVLRKPARGAERDGAAVTHL